MAAHRHIAKHTAYQSARIAAPATRSSHFHCFCHKAYYISNFKDFNTQAPAC